LVTVTRPVAFTRIVAVGVEGVALAVYPRCRGRYVSFLASRPTSSEQERQTQQYPNYAQAEPSR
jgi:hypothetical protein